MFYLINSVEENEKKETDDNILVRDLDELPNLIRLGAFTCFDESGLEVNKCNFELT